MTACDDCLRRTDLVAALAGWLDIEWRKRDAPGRVLARSDASLLDGCESAAVRARYDRFDPLAAREALREAGLAAICRCDGGYPERLRDLADPPAVLHVAGDPSCVGVTGAVAVVGARRATPYGLTVARELGCGLSAASVNVVSGLALGIDAAAHAGALEGAAAPVAVLAGGADRPYPASKRGLYTAVRAVGAVVSEMPPGLRHPPLGVRGPQPPDRRARAGRGRRRGHPALRLADHRGSRRRTRSHRGRRSGPNHLRGRGRHQRAHPGRRGTGPRRARRARRAGRAHRRGLRTARQPRPGTRA